MTTTPAGGDQHVGRLQIEVYQAGSVACYERFGYAGQDATTDGKAMDTSCGSIFAEDSVLITVAYI
jgi:hypothetical protein